MDVLLIGRSVTRDVPALGIAYLGSYLISRGFSVGLTDLYSEERSIGEIVDSRNPRIIGISGLTIDMPRVYRLADMLKKRSSGTVIIAGGLHPSALPRETLEECQNIDAVVIGEGEYTLAKIASLENIPRELPTVDGVAYRNASGIAITSEPSHRPDLDRGPFLFGGCCN